MAGSIVLRVARQLVVLTLLFFLSPGLSAATADALHLAIAGHTVDADEASPREATHHDSGPCSTEHHCSGAFHTCGCAAQPALTVPSEALRPGVSNAVAASARAIFAERHTSSRDGVEGQFKPPRA